MPNADLFSAMFPLLLFAAAFLYSSVGHGGASAYLALMALAGYSPAIARPTALIMNCMVSLIAFSLYATTARFHHKLFLSLALGSVPASFIGARFVLDDDLYKRVLAGLLIISALKLLFDASRTEFVRREVNTIFSVFIGLCLGFVSGLIGIGGGVMLSPLLVFLRWSNMRETAQLSSLFIFVNSVAGLVGLATAKVELHTGSSVWIAAALAGALAGSLTGSRFVSMPGLKRLLGLAISTAAVKLLL